MKFNREGSSEPNHTHDSDEDNFKIKTSISRKNIYTLLSQLLLFCAIIVAVAWFANSSDLKGLKRENLVLTNRIFTTELREIKDSLATLGSAFADRPGMSSTLSKVATFGPLYVLQKSDVGQAIDSSSKVYLEQAIIRALSDLKGLQSRGDISEAILYEVSPHNIIPGNHVLPLMRLRPDKTWLYEYLNKGAVQPSAIHEGNTSELTLKGQSFFDGASLDSALAAKVFTENGFINSISPDDPSNSFEHPKDLANPQSFFEESRSGDGIEVVSITPLKMPVFELESGENKITVALILELRRSIDKTFLIAQSEKLGSKIILSSGGKVLASSFGENETFSIDDDLLLMKDNRYLHSLEKLESLKPSANHTASLEVGVLSDYSETLNVIYKTVGYLALITLIEGLLRMLMQYAVIQRMVVEPISTLLQTIGRIRTQGDFSMQIKSEATDEFGALTYEFNRMVRSVRTSLDLVKASEATQRRILKCTNQLSKTLSKGDALTLALEILTEEHAGVSVSFASVELQSNKLFQLSTDQANSSFEVHSNDLKLLLSHVNDRKSSDIGEFIQLDDSAVALCFYSNAVSQEFIVLHGVETTKWSASKEEVTKAVAASLNVALTNFAYFGLKEEQSRISAELAFANLVQKSIVPELPAIRQVDLRKSYVPSAELSGDWYGLQFEEESGLLFGYLCDVTGHGFHSALVSGVIAGSAMTARFVSLAIQGSKDLRLPAHQRLEHIAEAVNLAVLETGSKQGIYATGCFFCLNVNSGLINILNAAHPPVIHICQGSTSNLPSSGFRLGVERNASFGKVELQLKTGDALFLYTDGLIENCAPTLRPISVRQLKTILQRAKSLDLAIEEISALAVEKLAGTSREDDVTIVAIQWHGSRQESL